VEVVAGYKILEFLARETTPKAGRKEIMRRLKEGERVSRKRAKKIADKHRPKPKQAAKLARETGKPVLASDGYIYLGATDEQARKADERRTVVFSRNFHKHLRRGRPERQVAFDHGKKLAVLELGLRGNEQAP
jgi:hypothetical protein